MGPSAAIEAALRLALPEVLRDRAGDLAQLLEQLSSGAISVDEAQKRLIGSPELQPVLGALFGRHLKAGGALIGFGTGNQVGDIVIHDVAGRDLISVTNHLYAGDALYNLFSLSPAPLASHIRQREFQSLIDERTRDFVGREHVFATIDQLLADPGFPSGYIVIRGEPGIGKTALASRLVKERGYLHHFNIAPQNIRSARAFLENICAQLIVRYNLSLPMLPPVALEDSGFLLSLLREIAGQTEAQPLVLVVDALDEADDDALPARANRLYLPSALPPGVFVIVTIRELHDDRLLVDRRKDLALHDDDLHNLADVERYIRAFIETNRAQLLPQLQRWQIGEKALVALLSERSQGNFMYLVYVLRDLLAGRSALLGLDDIRQLPQGLRGYYQRHWRAMRAHDQPRFEQLYEPVVCLLATVFEPVSVAQLAAWTKLSPARVATVIADWREYLNEEEGTQGERLYRVYHTSFQEFLRDEVGLTSYHRLITRAALDKLPWKPRSRAR
jgi:hypothetical protein